MPNQDASLKKPIHSRTLFNKFINWVSAEFDSYFQDNSEGLKVYLPNGWF